MKSDDDVEEWAEMAKQTKTEGIPRISSFHSSFSYSDSSFFRVFLTLDSTDSYFSFTHHHHRRIDSVFECAFIEPSWWVVCCSVSRLINVRDNQHSPMEPYTHVNCRTMQSSRPTWPRRQNGVKCCWKNNVLHAQKKQNMKMWSEFFLHHHHSLFHATVLGCQHPQATNKHDNVDDDKSLIPSLPHFFSPPYSHFRSSHLMLFSLNIAYTYLATLYAVWRAIKQIQNMRKEKRDSRLGEVLCSPYSFVFFLLCNFSWKAFECAPV